MFKFDGTDYRWSLKQDLFDDVRDQRKEWTSAKKEINGDKIISFTPSI
jgi:hypothetical protein